MSEISVSRTPELIAAEINNIKEQTRKQVLYNSIEIGRRLTEVKLMLPHGEWGSWLEKSVDYKRSTANNLMRIFEEYGADQINLLGESNSQAFGNLSYTQAIALLGIPSNEREEFVKENDVENMSTRDLQKVIKERDEARKKAEDKAAEIRKLSKEKVSAELKVNEIDKLFREYQNKYESVSKLLSHEKEKSEERRASLEKVIAENNKLLSTAKSDGNDKEVKRLQELINEMQGDLDNSAQRIDELEKQLSEKPVEITAAEIIEKVPEAVEKELEELRAKAQNIKPVSKFQVYFDALVNNFNDIIEALEEISDASMKGKYKKAVHGLIDKMEEQL